jgi:Zn finger protein HypA/HybF involved in hydrogenase expression
MPIYSLGRAVTGSSPEPGEAVAQAESYLTSSLAAVAGVLRACLEKVAAPLRTGEGPNKFDLSAAETATTTYDGDVGWSKRPPAIVRCPRCDAEIVQHQAYDSIDCPHCVEEFSYREFSDLELLRMGCPRCKRVMLHGQRHPERFDIPEWATCDRCRYHWEFKHSYDRPTGQERTDVR